MKTRRAFTLLEIICAVVLVGVITTISVATYNAVSRGWEVSTDYMDKMQRTDFALNQVISGLRSMYYPHNGTPDSNYDYGFALQNLGDGEDPDRSDIIEWSKTGTAIVGNKSAVADTVHRVQVMVLEEGDSDWQEEIEVTGLYARLCPDQALRPKDDEEIDYTFANDEMYQPVLIADGITGFNCRVLESPEKATSNAGGPEFEDEWIETNKVPYKVELTFYVLDKEAKSYRTNTAPLVRIVRIPMYEQSQDAALPPGSEDKNAAAAGAAGRGGRGGNSGGASNGGGRRGGGGQPPPGPPHGGGGGVQ